MVLRKNLDGGSEQGYIISNMTIDTFSLVDKGLFRGKVGTGGRLKMSA